MKKNPTPPNAKQELILGLEASEKITRQYSKRQPEDSLTLTGALTHWAVGQGKPISVPMSSIHWVNARPYAVRQFAEVARTAYRIPGMSTQQAGVNYNPKTGEYSKQFKQPITDYIFKIPLHTFDGMVYGQVGTRLEKAKIAINPISGQYSIQGVLYANGRPKEDRKPDTPYPKEWDDQWLDNFGFNPINDDDKHKRSRLAEMLTRVMHLFPGTPFDIHGVGSAPYQQKGNIETDLDTQILKDIFGLPEIKKHPVLSDIYRKASSREDINSAKKSKPVWKHYWER